MPNFTDGEWKAEDGFIWAHKDGMVKMIADFIPVEADVRLMAQSKKMYEVLKEIDDANFELVQLPDSIREKLKAILSEIDKE